MGDRVMRLRSLGLCAPSEEKWGYGNPPNEMNMF